MDVLKQIFPRAFKTSNVHNLIVNVIIYIVIGLIAGLIIGLANLIVGWIPFLGIILSYCLRILGALVDIYVVIAIIVSLLSFLKIIK